MNAVNCKIKLDSIKNFILSSKIKEGGKAICVVLAILVLVGASLGSCYGIALGIDKLIRRIGAIPAIIAVGLGTIASVWAICFIDKLIPGKTTKT